MKHIIVFFLCFSNLNVFAQWSTDPTQNLRVTTRGLLPLIIGDGTGGAYIAYNDMPLLGIHIFLQRLDKYGYRKFPGNGIMIADSSHFQGHRYFLINDNEGGVIMVFDDSFIEDGNGYTQTHVQRVDSTGRKLWGENGITVAPEANSRGLMLVSACEDGMGGCYVFWGFFYDRQKIDLRVQHLDSHGNFLLDESGVLVTDKFVSYNHPVPCLAVNDDEGGTIFYYYDSTGVKLQRLNIEDKLLWGNGIKPSSKGWWPDMKSDGSGGVIIAFYYEINEPDGVRSLIGVQRIDKYGNILWADDGVIITDLADDKTFTPQLVVDEILNSYIVWQDQRSGAIKVYVQRLDPYGAPQWRKDGIEASPSDAMKGIRFDFVPGPDSSIVVIWSDWRNEEASLRARRIDLNGKYLWPDDVLITKRLSFIKTQVASDGNGGAIVCWYAEPPDIGIYAQQISGNGILGEVVATAVDNKHQYTFPKNIQLFPNYPNPFNSQTVIKYSIPQKGNLELKIFDINGKEVITLSDKNAQAGQGQVIWNGRDRDGNGVASGIYFVHLQFDGFVKTRKILLIK